MSHSKNILRLISVVFVCFPFFASADVLTPVPIHFKVVASDAVLFDADISVSECLNSETGTTTSENAFCAIEEVASSSGWTLGSTWYPFGHSLDSINSYTPDFANNKFWIYYVNHNPGMSSLNAEVLVPGEELLLTFGSNPLRITPATTTPEVGTTTLITGQYFDPILFDWALATGTTFTIDGVATTSESGVLLFTPSTTTSYSISLSREGAISSYPITLFPFVHEELATSTPNEASTTPLVAPTVSTGGSASPEVGHTIDTSKAVNFLRINSGSDGLYQAELYNDWVAIGITGISGAEDIRGKLVLHAKESTDPGSLLTDLERRAMALEALGIDPSLGTSRDYIKEILTHFDGVQWGDKNEVNDDIFALIPLLHAGYTESDDIIIKTVSSIVGAQGSNGSWGSIDLTAAGIIALQPVATLPGVGDAIQNGKQYLHSVQGEDGGFGTSFATSWVLMAINALPGEDISRNWKKNGRTLQDYLWLLQEADGGIESKALDQSSRVWATAYAVPASSGKSWNTMLGSYPKTLQTIVSSGSIGGSSGEVLGIATTTATTTLQSATSTLLFATSTASTSPALKTGTSSLELIDVTTLSGTTTVKVASSSKNIIKKTAIAKKKSTVLTKDDIVLATSTKGTSTVEVSSSSWTRVITAPFQRLFQSVRSWFD